MTGRLRSECIRCMLKKYLEKYPADITENQKIEYMQRMLKVFADAPREIGAPVIVRTISQIQEEMFGIRDAYAGIKKHFNEIMMEREDEIAGKIDAAQDPLRAAIQYAMVGNYIDYGAMKDVDEEYLTGLLDSAEQQKLDPDSYERLKKDLQSAGSLAYITDNCGEIVMDKLLIRTIQKQYPQVRMTVVVRGQEIINDATMEDAVQVGLTEIVPVIGNGSDIAGTWMKELSEEARTVIENADVILAKGQGNYETLRGSDWNLYYLFLCKCEMFAENFHVPRFTGMLVHEETNV